MQDELDSIAALCFALEALRLTYKKFLGFREYFSPDLQQITFNFLRRCEAELFSYSKIPAPLRIEIANLWVVQLALVRQWIVECIPTVDLPANVLTLRFFGHNQETEPYPALRTTNYDKKNGAMGASSRP